MDLNRFAYNKYKNRTMGKSFEEINWIHRILDCSRNGIYAVVNTSLSDCINYYWIIAVNRIQLLLLRITGS